MRENMGLYRGKRTATGEWVYGALYKQDWYYGTPCNRVYIIISAESLDYNQALEYYEVDPKTVGQFTGLYNGAAQRIFEGDIVRFDEKEYVVQRECDTPGGYWAETGHLLKRIGWTECLSFTDTIDNYFNEICVEVIGNIHDNPKLLEVK